MNARRPDVRVVPGVVLADVITDPGTVDRRTGPGAPVLRSRTALRCLDLADQARSAGPVEVQVRSWWPSALPVRYRRPVLVALALAVVPVVELAPLAVLHGLTGWAWTAVLNVVLLGAIRAASDPVSEYRSAGTAGPPSVPGSESGTGGASGGLRAITAGEVRVTVTGVRGIPRGLRGR